MTSPPPPTGDLDSNENELTLDELRRIDEICGRFETDWKRVNTGGPPPSIPVLLNSVDEVIRPHLLGELARIERHYRNRR